MTTIECPACNGSGEHWTQPQDPSLTEAIPCWLCQGTGETTPEAVAAHTEWLAEQEADHATPDQMPPLRDLLVGLYGEAEADRMLSEPPPF